MHLRPVTRNFKGGTQADSLSSCIYQLCISKITEAKVFPISMQLGYLSSVYIMQTHVKGSESRFNGGTQGSAERGKPIH